MHLFELTSLGVSSPQVAVGSSGATVFGSSSLMVFTSVYFQSFGNICYVLRMFIIVSYIYTNPIRMKYVLIGFKLFKTGSFILYIYLGHIYDDLSSYHSMYVTNYSSYHIADGHFQNRYHGCIREWGTCQCRR